MLNWTYFHLESRGRSRHVRDHLNKKYYRYYSPSIVGHVIMRLKLFNYHQLKGQIAACVIVLFIAACTRNDFVPLQINPAMRYITYYSARSFCDFVISLFLVRRQIRGPNFGTQSRSFILSAYFLHFSLILLSLLIVSL